MTTVTMCVYVMSCYTVGPTLEMRQYSRCWLHLSAPTEANYNRPVQQWYHLLITTNVDLYRNTKNIKIVVENATLCGKNMGYAHFAEICDKCGNMQNMRQLHMHG